MILGNAHRQPRKSASRQPQKKSLEKHQDDKQPVHSNALTEAATVVHTRTAYERLTDALQNDPRFEEEVALGRRLGPYKFVKDIGRGNFSKVKLATHQLTRDNVSVKIVDRARLDARAQRMLSSEVLTLESLNHPNILRLFQVVDMWNRVYLVTEFVAGGELYHKISLDGALREEQAILLFRQLLDAVKYMVSIWG